MSEADAGRAHRRSLDWKEAAWALAHLAVLCTFALAQPLFDLLKDNPEFFAARGSPGFDIVSFSLIAVVVPPLVLWLVELLAGLADRRAGRALHLAFVGLLVALIAVQALKKAVDASDAVLIVVSLAIGAALAALYARTEGVRQFMTVLSPAPLVFLLIFLFVSPVAKLAFPSEADARSVGGVARAPIVMILFDELPTTSLLDSRGRIDAKRYPAFAELARRSTWFRNAYTVYDSTERAQPAIYDGNLPTKDKLPTSADHPNSIFTLFGKSHRMHVSEEATSVCPQDLCEDERLEESYGSRMESMLEDLGLVWLHVVAPPKMEADLPSVSENWGNFGGGDGGGGGGAQAAAAAQPQDSPAVRENLQGNRNRRFDAWVEGIEDTNRPGLNFKHTLLPHVPWQYLPDGRQYRRTARDPIPQLSRQSYRDPVQIESLYQRHLLQTGFADRELGKVIRRLKDQGMWEKALVVVAADHGVAFRTGAFDRRRITRRNAEEIAPVPFIIKAPGQRRGRVDDAYAETIDILPTMLDVLDIDPKVKIDGKSAFSEAVKRRRVVRILERGSFDPLRFTAAEWRRRTGAALARKLSLFGDGDDGPLRLYRIGPRRELLFKPLSGFRVTAGSGARLVAPEEYRNVDLRSPTVPVHVTGYLKAVPNGRDLAIAVNGRIQAVTRSFTLATGTGPIFAAMVPPQSFRQGRNRVEVLEVTGPSTLRRLGQV